ncbi:MAG: hypothetical protein KC588_19150, partial [Nitrospira sp.]|nr:hypothetical protein [Nitrospira sp.]
MEVEVDGQLYTGSSVVKVTVQESEPLTKQLGYPLHFGATGEAAYVELPGNRYLFALLGGGPSNSGPQTNAVNIFEDRLPQRGIERFAVLSTSRFKTEIPESQYPLLVTFTDLTDPTTVKVVDPENLAATFGPGVSLKRLTLEITDEPVTEGKIEQFGFMGVLKKQGTLSGLVMADKNHPEPVNYLTSKAFKLGGKK